MDPKSVSPESERLSSISDHDVHRRVHELERELLEFQESSKELEQALEEELQQLEEQNATLAAQSQAKDAKITELNGKVVSLSSEINKLTVDFDEIRRTSDHTISKLKQQLVAIEILNDDMASQDRVLEQKLVLAQQFNNELLEKLALVENDLELERDVNAQQRLAMSNLTNATAKEVKIKRDSTMADLTMVDGTILDINEMLASEPPTNREARQISKLGSLHMIHELYSKSDALLNKVGDLNSTLKSGTTTETHRPDTRTVVHSPSVSNLSKLQKDSQEQKPARKPSVRAHNKEEYARPARQESQAGKKKSRLRDVMKNMFS